jgi:DNA-binding NtrC family response regulator
MKTILIVDDEEKIRKVYAQFLSNKGFRVVTADSAVEANCILGKKHIDLLLLDINMPEVDGSVLSEVTKLFHKDVKIIACSVHPVEEQKEIIKEAADYYEKSQGLDELFEKVTKALFSDTRKKILIVDDDSKISKLFCQLLSQKGYCAVAAESVLKALAYSKEHLDDIDLVILDLALPGLDGVDFFETIKKEQPKIKVIISSAYSIAEQKALIFDADDYYDKADSNAILLEKIDKLL